MHGIELEFLNISRCFSLTLYFHYRSTKLNFMENKNLWTLHKGKMYMRKIFLEVKDFSKTFLEVKSSSYILKIHS